MWGSNKRTFKMFDKVKHKYGLWDGLGVIDAITPQGKICVKLPNTYEWCYPNELLHADDPDPIPKKKRINLDYL